MFLFFDGQIIQVGKGLFDEGFLWRLERLVEIEDLRIGGSQCFNDLAQGFQSDVAFAPFDLSQVRRVDPGQEGQLFNAAFFIYSANAEPFAQLSLKIHQKILPD